MSAGALREKITVQKRTGSAQTGFVTSTNSWTDHVAAISARIRPLPAGRGAETVIAERLNGTEMVEITVRSSTETRAITSNMRVEDDRTARIYNIKHVANFDEKDRYLVLTCVAGEDNG